MLMNIINDDVDDNNSQVLRYKQNFKQQYEEKKGIRKIEGVMR